VGRPDFITAPWFAHGIDRAQHADELDLAVGGWIAARDLDEVVRAFEAAEAAVAPIPDVGDVMRDPQYRALGSIVGVPDPELGEVKMQNVLFRMLGTPGRVRWAGRRLGEDNAAVYGELGVTAERLGELQSEGVI
jgi:crotonobetainyl-CoA:carnitine CoA-transferase CaiB-like acyl-CoA transferase